MSLEIFIAFIAGLPIGGFITWLADRLFGPAFDEIGLRIRDYFKNLDTNEYSLFSAYSELEKMISDLHIKHGHHHFHILILNDREINKKILSYSRHTRRKIGHTWIEQGTINDYAESDVFFAGVELLLPYLSKEEMQMMFDKHKENDQAALWPFFETVEIKRPELLTVEMLQYLRANQQKWQNRTERAMLNKGISRSIPQEQLKEESKEKVAALFEKQQSVTNNDVEKLLGVSDATATRYLSELEKEGKVQQLGKTGRSVSYFLTETAQRD